jgi:MOSC domain-containing protein YiiM
LKAPVERRLLSVQVAAAQPVFIDGRRVMTAIHKRGVSGPVLVGPLGLYGDEQADLSVHGGLEKAVYAYPAEHYPFWQAGRLEQGLSQAGDNLPHGSLGENLTLQGLLENEAWVGDVLRFPNCELQLRSPREPCYKFNAAMGFSRAAKLMAQSGLCGFYLSVLKPGSLAAGQNFELIPGRRSLRIDAIFAAKMGKYVG